MWLTILILHLLLYVARLREEKIRQQRQLQEERLQRALARAQADIKKKVKPAVFANSSISQFQPLLLIVLLRSHSVASVPLNSTFEKDRVIQYID